MGSAHTNSYVANSLPHTFPYVKLPRPFFRLFSRAMAQGTKATVVAFQREQGFGRVAVEGQGELPFDAVVALPAPEKLVPGVEVRVEIGPSRIPGKLKIIKLWIGDAPP